MRCSLQERIILEINVTIKLRKVAHDYPLLFQRSRKLTFPSSNTRERLFKPLNVTETHRLQHLSFRLNCPTISDGQLLRRKAACFLPTRNVLKLFNTNTNRYVNELLNTCAASILNHRRNNWHTAQHLRLLLFV